MQNKSNGYSTANEDIEALSAGTVKAVLLEEDWKKPEYYIKARLEADPNEVARSLETLIENSKISKILKNERKEKNEAFKKIEELSHELKTATNSAELSKQYAETVRFISSIESYNRGRIARIKGQDSALELFKEAANLNNGNAQYMLGEMYAYGDAGVVDMDRSKAWFKKSIPLLTKESKNNNIESQYNLGRLYSNPEFGFPNDKEAKNWLRKAVNNGHLDAHIQLAWMSPKSEAKRLNKIAHDLAYHLAVKNDIDACFILGELYQGAEGIKPNYLEAEKWLKCAASQDDLTAIEFLADLYYRDDTGMQSIVKLKSLIKSNLESNSYIYYLIGKMHLEGLGGADRNIRIAKIWLDLAKKTGNKNADNALQNLTTTV